MSVLIARRLARCVVLFLLSLVLSYALASTALDPRAYFEDRRPPPPARVVDRELARLGMDDRAPLPERVDAEARQALGGVGDVEVARLLELVVARRRACRHFQQLVPLV